MSVDTETYYRRYGPMVLRRCRRLLRDEEKARDAMHDVFVELIRREHRLVDAAPSSLLYRMATNICLNRLRSDRRRPEDAESELVQRIADAADLQSETAARSLLAALFHREQKSTRTIAVLHLHDGMTLEEVASEVGLSVSGVRKRLRKLRDRLPGIEGERSDR